MGTTKYFAEVGQLKEKYSAIKISFEKSIKKTIDSVEEAQKSDKEIFADADNLALTRKLIDKFDNNIEVLKNISKELGELRSGMDDRGKLFKTGQLKKKFDQILTGESVKSLKDEMKKYVNILKKCDARKDYKPLVDYIESYKINSNKIINKSSMKR